MPFNIFKKKKEDPVREEPKAKENEGESQKEAPKKTKAAKRASSFGVLVQPHITEKAALLNEKGKYVFRVAPRANKTSVKNAVEGAYGVEVKQVRINRKPDKTVRVARTQGRQPGYKKAIVTLKHGQSIEIVSR